MNLRANLPINAEKKLETPAERKPQSTLSCTLFFIVNTRQGLHTHEAYVPTSSHEKL